MKKVICILLTIILTFSCIAVVACNKVADNTEYYDTITKKCKLEKSYEGKSFLEDGIGLATVSVYTDGDTTRFKTGGNTVIIRYYCIDTPESTGSVEKWGKAASLFVKEQLSQATEIVLESSTGGIPEKDSYGTRYLGYVWYKTADSDFKLLNLELIENGFTENKAINTKDYAYYEYMNEANKFARSVKLRIYSDLDDPLYTDKPELITLKDFWNNTEDYYFADVDAGIKVAFDACYTDLKLSNASSPTYTFTAVQYDPETGEEYSINVYAAYVSNNATKMKIGHLYKIIGTVQYYNGAYQISGIIWDSLYQSQDLYRNKLSGSYIIQKNYYLTFNSSITYMDQYSENLYSNATIKTVDVTDGELTLGVVCNKVTSGNKLGDEFEFTVKVNVAEDYTSAYNVGDIISFNGYQLEENSGVITVPNISDITKK